MEINGLVSLIKKRQEELNLIVSSRDEELAFFDEVITNNSLSTVSGLLNLDVLNIMIAYLCTVSCDFNYLELREMLEKNLIITEPGFKEITEDILDYLEEKNYGDDNITLNEIVVMLEEQGVSTELFDIDDLDKLYRYYEEELFKIISIAIVVNEMRYSVDNGVAAMDKILSEYDIRFSNKKREEFLLDYLKSNYNISKISEYLSVIEQYYSKIRGEDRKVKREARKANSNYDEFIRIVSKLNKEKLLNISNFNNMVNLISDEEILREFLKICDKELKVYFNELNGEYLKLLGDNEVNVQAVFKKYGFDFNKLFPEVKNKVLDLELVDLEEFLNNIKLLNVEDKEMVNYILLNSNSYIVNSLVSYIKDGILTLDFILGNKKFLSSGENGYNSLINIFKLLKGNGINSRLFINDLDVYLVDYELLRYNISVLKQYNLLFGIGKLESFELLKSNDLEVKIDLLLELGYEKFLEDDIGFLNIDIIDVKKLYILKSLGMLPSNIEELKKVLGNDSFMNYVDDSYMFNIVDHRINNELIREKVPDTREYFMFNNGSRVIDIGGVYISSNKFNRNYLKFDGIGLSDEDRLLYSLVYGSILSEEEYNIIISNMNNVRKKL